MTVLLPDLLYRDDAFQRDLALEVDEATGRIRRVLSAADVGDVRSVPLRGCALLPGFVNAHSHAFQRLLRGRAQSRSAGAAADFWSWRTTMYAVALALDPEDVYASARHCFIEMLRAGITTVGEFHYLHNQPDGRRYADGNELGWRVLAAAEDAGIRICLLRACYATGTIAQPLWPEHRRFATPDLDAYLHDTERLAAQSVGRPLISVGVAPHSVRAVPREWIRVLHAWAETRDLPLHMHASEQAAEVDACMESYGVRPIELLAEDLELDGGVTVIHATHINDHEVDLLSRTGVTVCACPTTERDLGDGVLRAGELIAAGGRIALGTDSHIMVDPFAEMRLLEYHERLRRRTRIVLTRPEPAGQRLENAPVLLAAGTQAGARSLRLHTGALVPGACADFVAIDLAHPALAGWTADTLPALLALCSPPDVVRDVWVAGRQVVTERYHRNQEDAMHELHRRALRIGYIT